MVKNKSGFVGVGAYGGNQVRPFYKESYPSLFINTALTDLKSLTDVEEEYKYHVPGSEGCNKDRKKSKELFRQEIDNIINEIKEKMSGIEYLFIVASAGGGCGSGVLAALKQVAMEEMDLKACIIITVLPDTKTESIKALINSYVYDLQVDGLDDLEDQLKEDLEKWSNELSGNLDKMSKAINNAINNSGASAADAMNTLAEVLKQFNITPDQLGISASNLSAGNIKKYDKGTKHIGHNSVAMTNENGREIVVTNKGWLTKLGASDQIISTDNTEALIEMAEKYRNNDLISNIKIPEIKSDGDRNVVYNYTNNSPVTIQGDLVRDTLPDLQTILKESNKYTQNEMRKNLRRT